MIANFAPTRLSVESEPNERVQALLFKAFPLLLGLDAILSFILSISTTYYHIFVKIVLYVLIYNWQLSYYLMPLLLTFIYCNVNFFVNSLYVDIYHDSPTIHEIMVCVNNLLIKFQRLKELMQVQFNVMNYLLILSPLYILLIRCELLSLRLAVLINSVVVTNMNSDWLIATLLLLRRFKFFKQLMLLDTRDPLGNFVIVNSLKENHKIIQFQIRHNQRRLVPILSDFQDALFPFERGTFTNLQNIGNYAIDKVPFSNINFKWLDETWKVEQDWVYSDYFWLNKCKSTHPMACTRSRILHKKAILVDK